MTWLSKALLGSDVLLWLYIEIPTSNPLSRCFMGIGAVIGIYWFIGVLGPGIIEVYVVVVYQCLIEVYIELLVIYQSLPNI